MKQAILLFFNTIILAGTIFAQQVNAVSEMRKVMMGHDLGIHLRWDTVAPQHLFGISPIGRLQGEVTIIDGQPFISTVAVDGTVRVERKWEVEAPFGVYAHVPEWEVFDFGANTSNESELQAALEKRIAELGYDMSKPTPFRLRGTFERVDYHILSKPTNETEHNHDLHDKAKKHFTEKNTSGELLGFYSQRHEGVFTHRGSYIHVHFVDDDHRNAGHVETAVVSQKTKLLLPKRQPSTGTIRVNDTDFSKGRLGFQQDIMLNDLVKFHGHLCDGLLEGYLAMQQGLNALYPEGIADRTNTRSVSKPSPCLTDAALFLSGGRYQYGSFYVSADFEGLYILQRVDNGRAVAVVRKPGVKPAVIDDMGDKAIAGQLSPCELDELKALEERYLAFLRQANPADIFEVRELEGFEWRPVLKNDFLKSDILNKHVQPCKH